MLDIPMVLDMKITGRQTGKTLVHVIKTLFSEDTPIRPYRLKEMRNISDRYCTFKENNNYTKWYRDFLIEIYHLLIKNGIIPRRLVLKEKDPKLTDEAMFERLEKYREKDLEETSLYYKLSKGGINHNVR